MRTQKQIDDLAHYGRVGFAMRFEAELHETMLSDIPEGEAGTTERFAELVRNMRARHLILGGRVDTYERETMEPVQRCNEEHAKEQANG